MPKQSRRAFLVIAAAVAAAASAASAHGQTAPKVVKFVVPYAAGGPADLAARLLADKLRPQGIQVIVDNRAGADGSIGAVAVAKAPPDGTTYLFAGAGLVTVNPHIRKDLAYNAQKDFSPVAMLAYADTVFVVAASHPAQTMAEFVRYAKASRPPVALASGGAGTTTHLYLELIKDSAGFDYLHVPYKGSSPALTDVLAGQTQGTVTALSITLPYIRSGKLKALGLVAARRSVAAPEIPTFAEQGYKNLDIVNWWALLAPAGIPAAAQSEMAAAVANALADDDLKSRFLTAGITPWFLPGTELSAVIGRESDRWKRLIAERHIQAVQ